MMGSMAEPLDGEIHVAGDLRNFGSWMASEQKRIFLLCRRLLQDPDEADSATQDAFLKAFKALSRNGSEPADMHSPGIVDNSHCREYLP
jgi:DNA-directed RNA polymerase specialized sigma24 family protein